MAREARLIQRVPLGADLGRGCFFAPQAFEIDAIARLEGEVFGPILHVVRFAGDRLDEVIDAINGTGYGLTLGVHSRIDRTIDRVLERARAGNIYVNRNMIGAVVGVQPFGGERLSGTGPEGRRAPLSARASRPSARSASTPPRSAATPACSASRTISADRHAPAPIGRSPQRTPCGRCRGCSVVATPSSTRPLQRHRPPPRRRGPVPRRAAISSDRPSSQPSPSKPAAAGSI